MQIHVVNSEAENNRIREHVHKPQAENELEKAISPLISCRALTARASNRQVDDAIRNYPYHADDIEEPQPQFNRTPTPTNEELCQEVEFCGSPPTFAIFVDTSTNNGVTVFINRAKEERIGVSKSRI